RRLDRVAVPLHGDVGLNSLACRTGAPVWSDAIHILPLAGCLPCLHSVSPLEHRTADLMRAVAEQTDRDARMHGIHHSIVERETNSNWSSGLTVWDWLHGTLRLNVPQGEVTVGVPAFQEPKAVTLPRILAIPFEHLPPSWEFRLAAPRSRINPKHHR